MTIKIQTKETVIPVQIGDLNFGFDVTDEAIKRFRREGARIEAQLEKISDDDINDDNAIDFIKAVLKDGFELMLGEGSFEKLYELSPSVIILMEYYTAVAKGIEAKLQTMGMSSQQEELAKKYLAKKKKR